VQENTLPQQLSSHSARLQIGHLQCEPNCRGNTDTHNCVLITSLALKIGRTVINLTRVLSRGLVTHKWVQKEGRRLTKFKQNHKSRYFNIKGTVQDVDQPVGNLTKAIPANLVQGNIIHVSVQGYILRRVSCEWLIGQIASHRTAPKAVQGAEYSIGQFRPVSPHPPEILFSCLTNNPQNHKPHGGASLGEA
jgi:hypothetical protein